MSRLLGLIREEIRSVLSEARGWWEEDLDNDENRIGIGDTLRISGLGTSRRSSIKTGTSPQNREYTVTAIVESRDNLGWKVVGINGFKSNRFSGKSFHLYTNDGRLGNDSVCNPASIFSLSEDTSFGLNIPRATVEIIEKVITEAKGWWEEADISLKVGDHLRVFGTDSHTQNQYTNYIEIVHCQTNGKAWQCILINSKKSCFFELVDDPDVYCPGPYCFKIFFDEGGVLSIYDADIEPVSSVNEAKGWWEEEEIDPNKINVGDTLRITGIATPSLGVGRTMIKTDIVVDAKIEHGWSVTGKHNIRSTSWAGKKFKLLTETAYSDPTFAGSIFNLYDDAQDLIMYQCEIVILEKSITEAVGWWSEDDEPDLKVGDIVRVTGNHGKLGILVDVTLKLTEKNKVEGTKRNGNVATTMFYAVQYPENSQFEDHVYTLWKPTSEDTGKDCPGPYFLRCPPDSGFTVWDATVELIKGESKITEARGWWDISDERQGEFLPGDRVEVTGIDVKTNIYTELELRINAYHPDQYSNRDSEHFDKWFAFDDDDYLHVIIKPHDECISNPESKFYEKGPFIVRMGGSGSGPDSVEIPNATVELIK